MEMIMNLIRILLIIVWTCYIRIHSLHSEHMRAAFIMDIFWRGRCASFSCSGVGVGIWGNEKEKWESLTFSWVTGEEKERGSRLIMWSCEKWCTKLKQGQNETCDDWELFLNDSCRCSRCWMFCKMFCKMSRHFICLTPVWSTDGTHQKILSSHTNLQFISCNDLYFKRDIWCHLIPLLDFLYLSSHPN